MCPYTYTVKGNNGQIYNVSCGHCPQCKRSRSREWALRLTHEMSTNGHVGKFVTLTYADEYLTYTDPHCLTPTLVKDHLKSYLKSLRQLCRRRSLPIKYYAVGEYGDKYGRPHYHAIIIGPKLDDSVYCKYWSYGLVDIGTVTTDSICYVTGYVRKKLHSKLADSVYGKRQHPFSLSARGIGADYARQNIGYVDSRHCYTLNGKQVAIPRYYIKRGIVNDNIIDSINADRRVQDYKDYVDSGLTWIDWIHKRRSEGYQKNINILAKPTKSEGKL